MSTVRRATSCELNFQTSDLSLALLSKSYSSCIIPSAQITSHTSEIVTSKGARLPLMLEGREHNLALRMTL